MPYNAGDGHYVAGDHYVAGGILGSIGKAIGGVAKGIFKATPLGMAVTSVAPNLLGGTGGGKKPNVLPVLREPGISGFAHRLIPGGSTGYVVPAGGGYGRRRRKMDYGNMKALRRADRRAHGFLRAYSKAVRHFVAKQPKGKAYVHFKKKSK